MEAPSIESHSSHPHQQNTYIYIHIYACLLVWVYLHVSSKPPRGPDRPGRILYKTGPQAP